MQVARCGEKHQQTHFRTDRFYRINEAWYFSTREGIEMGPYTNKTDAELALSDLFNANDWGSSPPEGAEH